MTVEELIAVLQQALAEPIKRAERIDIFQRAVWSGLDESTPEEVSEVLRELAWDLEFFEPNRAYREEDRSFYGHARAEKEIREALEKLRSAGVG